MPHTAIVQLMPYKRCMNSVEVYQQKMLKQSRGITPNLMIKHLHLQNWALYVSHVGLLLYILSDQFVRKRARKHDHLAKLGSIAWCLHAQKGVWNKYQYLHDQICYQLIESTYLSTWDTSTAIATALQNIESVSSAEKWVSNILDFKLVQTQNHHQFMDSICVISTLSVWQTIIGKNLEKTDLSVPKAESWVDKAESRVYV